MKRWGVALGLVTGVLLATVGVVAPAQAATDEVTATTATYTKTVRYGPFTIPGGTTADPGMIHNRLLFFVQKACTDCYITSFRPDLVYADGSKATMATGPMLHHAVWTSQLQSDATCSGTWLGLAGERFFASGNERTAIAFPAGYGYRVRWYDSWHLLVDLMNHSTTAKTVYVQLTVDYRPSSESVQRLKPLWLDIDQCGDSEYSIPAGYSDTHRDWRVTLPGRVIAMLGHVHGHGIAVEVTNQSRGGASICRSLATLDPKDVHSVLAMSTCTGNPLATIGYGEILRLHSEYNSTHAASDVMGIMLGYVRPA
jgi:hypothetical protein